VRDLDPEILAQQLNVAVWSNVFIPDRKSRRWSSSKWPARALPPLGFSGEQSVAQGTHPLIGILHASPTDEDNMRPLSSLLLALGVLLGIGVGVGLLLGVQLPGVPWLVAVGFVKLALIASGGLMAGGAVLRRLAKRDDERQRLGSGRGAP
jgi:hypothetical protein